VFIYLVGTTESYTNNAAILAIDEMAKRGYVAASVEYPNGDCCACGNITSRAQCVFDSASAVSAVSVLCSRAKADCSKGIVVAGFSQGSLLAIVAKNYDTRVEAAYGKGAGVDYSFQDVRPCVANGNRTLSSDRLRVVNGDSDGFLGGGPASVRAQLEELTGFSCGAAAFSCFQPNGSGWYMVQGSQLSDGSADHCYFLNGDPFGCNGGALDPGWPPPATNPWSLTTNLDWLTNFTLP